MFKLHQSLRIIIQNLPVDCTSKRIVELERVQGKISYFFINSYFLFFI